MSRSLRSYKPEERMVVVKRRLKIRSKFKGLGYWAAKDYMALIKKGRKLDAT
jgi:hypothetical protein